MRFYMVQYCSCGIPDEPIVCMTAEDVRYCIRDDILDARDVQCDATGLPRYVALNDSSELRVFDFNIIARCPDANGYITITRLHKDDLRSVYANDATMLAFIDEISDTQMAQLARKMADDYLEQLYWDSLKTLFEEYIYPELPVPYDYFECAVCGEIYNESDISHIEDEDICQNCYEEGGN